MDTSRRSRRYPPFNSIAYDDGVGTSIAGKHLSIGSKRNPAKAGAAAYANSFAYKPTVDPISDKRCRDFPYVGGCRPVCCADTPSI